LSGGGGGLSLVLAFSITERDTAIADVTTSAQDRCE